MRDFAALNKISLLCWDCWALGDGNYVDLSQDDMALLDRVARLSVAGDACFEELRTLYLSDERLCVPSLVKSYQMDESFEMVDVRQINPAFVEAGEGGE